MKHLLLLNGDMEEVPSPMDMLRDMSNMTPEELEKMLPKEGMDDLSKNCRQDGTGY